MPPPRRLAFDATVSVLFVREMGPRLSSATRLRLAEDGLNLGAPLRAAYPAEQVAGWIELCLPEAFPGLTREEALAELGRRTTLRYGAIPVGRALLVLLRVVGLRRTLEHMPRAVRTGNNYQRVDCRVHGPQDVELTFSDVFGQQDYVRGVLEAAAELCRVRTARVEQVALADGGATFRVRWEPGG
jgi:uncharacterized protein (TIGR02265 family)